MTARTPSPDPFTGGDDPFAAILEGLADARVDEAAAARERAGWAMRRAEEDATLAGALVDLAERQAEVRLRLRGGRMVSGTPRRVGPDAVALDAATGRTYARLAHVLAVHLRPGRSLVPSAAHEPTGAATTRTLHDVVCDATAARAEALVLLDDGSELRGELRAMGVDVLTVRENSATRATVLVSFEAVAGVTLLTER